MCLSQPADATISPIAGFGFLIPPAASSQTSWSLCCPAHNSGCCKTWLPGLSPCSVLLHFCQWLHSTLHMPEDLLVSPDHWYMGLHAHRAESPSPRKIKMEFNEKTGQAIAIRHRAWPEKSAEQLTVCTQSAALILFLGGFCHAYFSETSLILHCSSPKTCS